eukprot:1678948-Amphidinium_carterae.1
MEKFIEFKPLSIHCNSSSSACCVLYYRGYDPGAAPQACANMEHALIHLANRELATMARKGCWGSAPYAPYDTQLVYDMQAMPMNSVDPGSGGICAIA